ncbi:uncharacterized protein LOC123953804 [Meles meles]|uniref:uncharacterized protein LOC123953804 n=1 Tax=Meles meles TaxID=9662 RepID=UPI001E698529|nr:uncharacterized protein LOC123953804 [Meles meles]
MSNQIREYTVTPADKGSGREGQSDPTRPSGGRDIQGETQGPPRPRAVCRWYFRSQMAHGEPEGEENHPGPEEGQMLSHVQWENQTAERMMIRSAFKGGEIFWLLWRAVGWRINENRSGRSTCGQKRYVLQKVTLRRWTGTNWPQARDSLWLSDITHGEDKGDKVFFSLHRPLAIIMYVKLRIRIQETVKVCEFSPYLYEHCKLTEMI